MCKRRSNTVKVCISVFTLAPLLTVVPSHHFKAVDYFVPADAAPDEALAPIEGGGGEGGGVGEDADPLAPLLAAAPEAEAPDAGESDDPADPAPPLADPPLLPDDGDDVPLLPDEPDELADPELGSRSVGVVLIDIPPALPPDEAAAAAADALPPAADSLRHHLLAQCRCERPNDH